MTRPTLAVVIPTLDAAARLPRCLAALDEWPDARRIVVDGGSADATIALARAAGATIIPAARGRGGQLAAGAGAAGAVDWLLFLHADTVLAPGWARAAEAFMAAARARPRAGYFRFALDDASAAARRLEAVVAWRCRRLSLPYGDQALLIERRHYDAVGGFRPLPLMEDVDLVRRLGARGLASLDHPAVTAATRYRAGYLRRSVRNLTCLALYFLGVSPRRLVAFYR